MSLSAEALIAIIALLVTLPPSVLIIWNIIRRKKRPTLNAADPGQPQRAYSIPVMLARRQISYVADMDIRLEFGSSRWDEAIHTSFDAARAGNSKAIRLQSTAFHEFRPLEPFNLEREFGRSVA